MTPEEMAIDAVEALQAGTNMTLARGNGVKMPPKFPRGELLCENHDGTRCYSYKPLKVLAWLSATGLVKVTATMIDKTKDASEPPLNCGVRATMSLCCGMVRAGWKEPSVMHDGLCRQRHGGELGPTYYLTDSGLTMDAYGVMRPKNQ